MGSDFYESPAERAQCLESGKVPLGVGAHTTIRKAIIDKNARIGRNVQIVNGPAKAALRQYNTSFANDILTITL